MAADSPRACSLSRWNRKVCPCHFQHRSVSGSRQCEGHRDLEKALDASSTRGSCSLIKCQQRQGGLGKLQRLSDTPRN